MLQNLDSWRKHRKKSKKRLQESRVQAARLAEEARRREEEEAARLAEEERRREEEEEARLAEEERKRDAPVVTPDPLQERALCPQSLPPEKLQPEPERENLAGI